jgi:hypothetical protein
VSAPANANGRRRRPASRRLLDLWERQACSETFKNTDELPLAAVLLSGLTLGADEGPGLDVLAGIDATVEGWIALGDPDDITIRVSKADLILLTHRLDVAIELVKRGAAAFPPVPAPPESTPVAIDPSEKGAAR